MMLGFFVERVVEDRLLEVPRAPAAHEEQDEQRDEEGLGRLRGEDHHRAVQQAAVHAVQADGHGQGPEGRVRRVRRM